MMRKPKEQMSTKFIADIYIFLLLTLFVISALKITDTYKNTFEYMPSVFFSIESFKQLFVLKKKNLIC